MNILSADQAAQINEKLSTHFRDDPWYRPEVIAAVHNRVLQYTRYLNRARPQSQPWSVSIWSQLSSKHSWPNYPPNDFAICNGNVYKYIGLKGYYILDTFINQTQEETGELFENGDSPGLLEWVANELKV